MGETKFHILNDMDVDVTFTNLPCRPETWRVIHKDSTLKEILQAIVVQSIQKGREQALDEMQGFIEMNQSEHAREKA